MLKAVMKTKGTRRRLRAAHTITEDDGTQIERKRKSKRRQSIRKEVENTELLNALRDFSMRTAEIGVNGLLREFAEVKATSTPPGQLIKTAFDSNTDKNRYKDVFCLDETRVILNYPPGESDYIHASWVSSRDSKKRFICTQAPKENTIDAFWRMIWQERCPTIIMLCNIIECGKKKCEQYWPANEGKSITYQTLKVTCNKVDRGDRLLTISQLVVSADVGDPINVEHILWNDWPDRGVPNCYAGAYRLLHRIKNQVPIVIHCSAGIGRTGTIVGLDIADQMLNRGEKVKMFDIVREMRKQRHGSVQTDIQYVYIHRCIIELAENKKAVKREEMQNFLKEYETLARIRGIPLTAPS